jgi:hypothetical protein
MLDRACLLSPVALITGVLATGVCEGGEGGDADAVSRDVIPGIGASGDVAAAAAVAIRTKFRMLPTLATSPLGGANGTALFVTLRERLRISSSVAMTDVLKSPKGGIPPDRLSSLSSPSSGSG